MNVKFYYNGYSPNRIDKNKDKNKPQLTISNVRFKEEGSLNITDPVLVIAPVDAASAWSDIVEGIKYNYFYIPKFTRWYFVKNIRTNGGLIEIEGECDVLYSFMDDILNSTQFVLRSQNHRSAYLPDSFLPIRNDHSYEMIPFGSYVDDKSCPEVMLITTGDGGTIVNPV